MVIENFTIVLVSVISITALFICGYVTSSVFTNIDKIGSNDNLKKIVTSRALFNFYAIIILIFVILARIADVIDTQLFIALFIGVIGGLGIKISGELFQK